MSEDGKIIEMCVEGCVLDLSVSDSVDGYGCVLDLSVLGAVDGYGCALGLGVLVDMDACECTSVSKALSYSPL